MAVAHELIRRAVEGVRPCLQLTPAATPGFSQLGGCPQLAMGVDWPSRDGSPLAFLAQVDLGEAPKVDWPDWMPREGRLSFFYVADQDVWGFDPKDRSGWAVLYAEPAATLCVRAPPAELPRHGRFTAKPVTFAPGRSIPTYERIGGYEENTTGAEFDEVAAFLDSLEDFERDSPQQHQMFGLPLPIQGDGMELECQLASHAVYVGDSRGFSDPRVAALKAGAEDWRLLLQIDSDDDVGMMWGDVGRLYFWVREQDAARRDFSNVWMVLQCY